MPLIDCDVHPYAPDMDSVAAYMPRAWQERFDGYPLPRAGAGPDRYANPNAGLRKDATPPAGGIPGSDPQFVAQDLLDKHDVAAALLLPMQGAGMTAWTDADSAAAFASAINDYMIERWVQTDSRYKLSAIVPPHDAELAAREIRRLEDVRGVASVMLPLQGTLMGHRSFDPLYEAAQEAGMPIVIHPTGAEGSYQGCPTVAGGTQRTYPGWHTALPQVAQSNLVSLVFDGTFEKFPKLRVAMVEFGFSWLVPTLWRMDKEWQNFRFEVPWVKRPPSSYVLEHVRFATQPIDEPAPRTNLWELVDLMDASQALVFSSDYPHYDNDDPMTVLKHIPAPVRQQMYDNAAALFGDRL